MGRLDGEVISQAKIDRLTARLGRNGVSVENGSSAARILNRNKADGGFSPSRDGTTARILLRPDATRYEIAHELKHYTEWLANPQAYVSRALRASQAPTRKLQILYGAETTLSAERHVFDSLKRTHFHRLSDAELDHARWYINDVTKDFHSARKLAK